MTLQDFVTSVEAVASQLNAEELAALFTDAQQDAPEVLALYADLKLHGVNFAWVLRAYRFAGLVYLQVTRDLHLNKMLVATQPGTNKLGIGSGMLIKLLITWLPTLISVLGPLFFKTLSDKVAAGENPETIIAWVKSQI